MANPFATPSMAAGYAKSRPAVHPLVISRVREHLGLPGGLGRGLDVGCGAGLSTRALQQIAADCLGIEPAEAMLHWGSSVAPGAFFVVGQAEMLPVRSDSMDIITAAGSLNYADLDLFFPEAARVLGPDGVLVIYDFSEGRSFRDSDTLDAWYTQFLERYPRPSDSGRELTPESLRTCCPGFRLTDAESFAIGLTLEPGFYLDYVLTETNVAEAVRNGIPEQEIRSWCAETLAPVFERRAREVVFRGYIAYMVRNPRTALPPRVQSRSGRGPAL